MKEKMVVKEVKNDGEIRDKDRAELLRRLSKLNKGKVKLGKKFLKSVKELQEEAKGGKV